jgi:hypothetical protein
MASNARAPHWPLEFIPMKIRHIVTSSAHIADKSFVECATTALLGLLWSGFAACILGALSYDIAYWFEGS